jgi:hypothetical protein
MAARGEEILVVLMENNEPYDIRGYQSRIFKLFCFDKEGLLHMAFYRISIFVAFLLAASMFAGMLYFGTPFISYTKALVLLMWILVTPQFFETAKAAAIIASRGIVFGKLNRSFTKYGVRKKASYPVLRVMPYVVMAVWFIGFIVMLELWFA